MNASTTDKNLIGANKNAFEPMTEKQMNSTRGGDDYYWYMETVGEVIDGFEEIILHMYTQQVEVDAWEAFQPEIELEMTSWEPTLEEMMGPVVE